MLHDTHGGPVLSLTELKGYRYTPKCHINVAYCFNHVGIPRTIPSQPCLYFLRRYPQIRVRIYRTPKIVPTIIKQTIQTIENTNDLSPKVHLVRTKFESTTLYLSFDDNKVKRYSIYKFHV